MSKWKRVIPHSDRELSKTCKVCDLHFLKADIAKTFKHIINSEVVEIGRDYWALKEGAAPVNFPNLPSYLSRKQTRRRSPIERKPPSSHKVITNEAQLPMEQQKELSNDEAPVPLHSTNLAQIVEKSADMTPSQLANCSTRIRTRQLRQIVWGHTQS